MMHTNTAHRYRRSVGPRLLLLLILPALMALVCASCGNPLGIDTPRRIHEVNLDSLVSSDPFLRARGDSIFAYIGGSDVVFATEVQRPVFHNRLTQRGYYVTVQATRFGLNGRDYEVLSLRLDAVRDTGTYIINSPYSAPKQIDTMGPTQYGAAYERRLNAGFPESYITGIRNASGTVRVVRIDETIGVMVGTFEFTGYSAAKDSIVFVDRGAFRLQLNK